MQILERRVTSSASNGESPRPLTQPLAQGGILTHLSHTDCIAAVLALLQADQLQQLAAVDSPLQRSRQRSQQCGNTLVVTSKETLEQWEAAMSAAVGLVEVCYTGAARERKRLDIRGISGADVVLTTYEVLR
jgi:SNF2 family DNA or RNA helicase